MWLCGTHTNTGWRGRKWRTRTCFVWRVTRRWLRREERLKLLHESAICLKSMLPAPERRGQRGAHRAACIAVSSLSEPFSQGRNSCLSSRKRKSKDSGAGCWVLPASACCSVSDTLPPSQTRCPGCWGRGETLVHALESANKQSPSYLPCSFTAKIALLTHL